MVYVISQEGRPLMPCSNVIARLLLKNGKAKVKKREPFTIKLTYKTTNYTQNLTLGVDTGSGTLGSAVVRDNGDVVYVDSSNLTNGTYWWVYAPSLGKSGYVNRNYLY